MDSKYTSLTLTELSRVILDRIALNDVESEYIRSLINCAAFIDFLVCAWTFLKIIQKIACFLIFIQKFIFSREIKIFGEKR